MSKEKIFQLKQEINKLLKEKPELKLLQDKIDKMLKSAGNQHNRMVLLDQMMKDKLKELGEKLNSLKSELVRFGSKNNE